MLLLRKKTAVIDNITFFSDDSDKNQFWYMPETIHIAEDAQGNPVFSLIKYTSDDVANEGGYINFEVNTSIDDSRLESAFQKFLEQMKVDPSSATKAPVPYDSGTVNFFVLDVKDPKDGLISVGSPSLIGKNSAIFSAKLSKEQVVILEQVFQKAEAPVAVAYNLSYTGITPALQVEVEAKFENIYKEFDAKFGANIPLPIETPSTFWLGFNSVIKNLEQNESLVIKVKESVPSDEKAKEKEWALDFVKGEILKSFFTASIDPNAQSNEQAKSASDSILNSLIEAAKETKSLLPGGSLEIKMVNIKETKTLNFNYESSTALTQSAVPQNYIGSDILKAKQEAPYYISVNTQKDPFFQKINYSVLGPDGFAEYGIKAASFQIKYNGSEYSSTDPFTADDGEWKKTLSRSSDVDELFDVNANYAFKSSSGWEGSASYQNEVKSASNMLNMDPGSFLSFNEISMLLDRSFTWDQYNQVIVELTYVDDKGRNKSKKFTFTSDQAGRQVFKYRCQTASPWKINYSITYFEVGGTSQTKQGSENPPAIVISPFVPATTNA